MFSHGLKRLTFCFWALWATNEGRNLKQGGRGPTQEVPLKKSRLDPHFAQKKLRLTRQPPAPHGSTVVAFCFFGFGGGRGPATKPLPVLKVPGGQ